MNFAAYSGKDLQNFMAMLNLCESSGITDIRFVREQLQSHIQGTYATAKVLRNKRRKDIPEERKPVMCPSCKKITLRQAAMFEGVKRLGCRCGYSEVTGWQ